MALSKIYARIYQRVFYLASFFLNWREPEIRTGKGSMNEIPEILKESGHKRPLLVTDGGIVKIGLFALLEEVLKESNIPYSIYSDVVPNPTVDNVESACKVYREENCDCIITIGGGSAMDCAKAAGARISNPGKPVERMRGLLKIRKKLPLLIAIPTTAGTGSETTLAAVISNSASHDKYPIEDPKLIPLYAVLDSTLTENLPPHITSTTGMDAFAHAVEAYIGHSNTESTKNAAIKAVKLIHENLIKVYEDGHNMTARTNMQDAAYYAGVAFTRAYVGCVHSIAHTLGAHYGTPHGLAVAVVLPHVLKYYGSSAHKRLSELSVHIGVNTGNDESANAKAFIDYIFNLNEQLDIPKRFKGIIKNEDIDEMVDAAYHEAVPLYPTPKILLKEDYRRLFKIIKE